MFNPLSAQVYRPVFLAVALLLTFMVFRARERTTRASHPKENPAAADWLLGLAALVAVGYAAYASDELFRRAAAPETLDIVGAAGPGRGGPPRWPASCSGPCRAPASPPR